MNWKGFKPQLLSNDEFGLDDLDYTAMVASFKHDGVRVECTKEGLFNRSLKELPNKELQEYFREFYETIPEDIVVEGEIWHLHKPCREIAGICNSLHGGKDLDGMMIMLFDLADLNRDDLTALGRNIVLSTYYMKKWIESPKISLIHHIYVEDPVSVADFYEEAIKQGFEGLVLNDFRKTYKRGRVTINQHIGFKIKPEKEEDLEIIGVNERFINTNESEINELGHKYKRNTVNDKQPSGLAGTFLCRLPNGNETKVTCTGTKEERKEMWENSSDYIGRYVVVKSMNYGTKDKPRHPRMIKIKEKIEK